MPHRAGEVVVSGRHAGCLHRAAAPDRRGCANPAGDPSDSVLTGDIIVQQQQTQPQGFAGRVGTWSARHKKSVLVGWLLFVALSIVGGGMISSNKLTKADQFSGESGRAEKTLETKFPEAAVASEMLLVTTRSGKRRRRGHEGRDRRHRRTRQGRAGRQERAYARRHQGPRVRRRPLSAGLVRDQGQAEDANAKIGPVTAAVKQAQEAHPGLPHRGVRRRQRRRRAGQVGRERPQAGGDACPSRSPC